MKVMIILASFLEIMAANNPIFQWTPIGQDIPRQEPIF